MAFNNFKVAAKLEKLRKGAHSMKLHDTPDFIEHSVGPGTVVQWKKLQIQSDLEIVQLILASDNCMQVSDGVAKQLAVVAESANCAFRTVEDSTHFLRMDCGRNHCIVNIDRALLIMAGPNTTWKEKNMTNDVCRIHF